MKKPDPLPKYPLGDSVTVEFIGKIMSVGYNLNGQLEYKVSDGKSTMAFVQETYLYPLPLPPEEQEKK